MDLLNMQVQCKASKLTPSNHSKSPQALSIGEEGHKNETVEVETLHENPVVISCQEVHKQGHDHLTGNL